MVTKRLILMTNKQTQFGLCLLLGAACALTLNTRVVSQSKSSSRQTVTLLQTLKQSSRVRLVAFSPRSQLLATVGTDGLVRLWNAQTSRFQKVLRGVHSDAGSGYLPRDIAFSPDEQTLVAAGDALEVWNTKSGTHRVLSGRGSFLQSVAFSPTGNLIATGAGEAEGAEPRVTVRNAQTGQVKWTKRLSHKENYVSAVKFSPNGRILVTAGSAVNLWDTADGKLLGQLKSSKLWGRDVSFSPDGKFLIVAFEKRSGSQINVYDAHSRKLLRTISVEGAKIREVGLSPASDFLVSSNDVSGEGASRDVRIWDFVTGRLLQRLPKQDAFAFSRDGKLLASSEGKYVKIWRVR